MKLIPSLSIDEYEKFWERVSDGTSSQCWTWTGSKTNQGYGQFDFRRVGKRSTFVATRVMWKVWHDEDPGCMLVCHTCDNPSCVNPHHLFLGTHQDNMRDKCDKGRWSGGGPPGERAGRVKLTEELVHMIRDSELGCRELGRQLNVHHSTVSAIRLRKIWRHI